MGNAWEKFVAHMGECHLNPAALIDFICSDSGNPHVVIGVDETLMSTNPKKTQQEMKNLINASQRKKRMVCVIATILDPFAIDPAVSGSNRKMTLVPLEPLSVALDSYPTIQQLLNDNKHSATNKHHLAAVCNALMFTGGHPQSIEFLHEAMSTMIKENKQFSFEGLVRARKR